MDKLEIEYNKNLIYHENTLKSVGLDPHSWLTPWTDIQNISVAEESQQW